MHITQIFETTVLDTESEAEARFIVVPRRAFSNTDLLPPPHRQDENEGRLTFQQLGEELGFSTSTMRHIFQPVRLVDAVATCLAANTPELAAQLGRSDEGVSYEFYQHQIPFAEILTLAPVVPFEESPIDLEAVASIITKASGVGLGAFAGFVIAGSSPLLFVTVPAGMIIFGAASGVAAALEEGLRERILRLIRRR